MKSRHFDHQGILILATLSLSIACWIWLLQVISPTEIIDAIGIKNGYLVMFLIALFGGVSSFSGVSYIATVLTLSAGGLSPLFLAVVSAVGISISDSAFYFIGMHSNHIIDSSRLKSWIDRSSVWLNRQSKLITGLIVYVYTGFTPLPTDLLTIILGLTRQPYLFVITVLTLGNFTFSFLLATLGNNFNLF